MNDSQNDLALVPINEAELPPARTEKNFAGINIGGNTVTESTEHLPEDLRVIVRAIFNDAREHKLTWKDIERETSKSSNFWYCVWTDRYRYPLKVKERFCRDCRKTVETKKSGVCKECSGRNVDITEKPHAQAGQPIPFGRETIEELRKWKARHDQETTRDSDFVEISIFKRIEIVSRRAFKHKRMAFVFGESHFGKTTTGKELARKYNDGQTTYVDTPPSPGKQLMLKMLAKALHVSSTTSFDNLLPDVAAALGPHKQVIFDNFHRVLRTYQKSSVVGCMDMILWLYDQSGCSMVVMATPQFAEALRDGEFRQYLKQFNRRGVYELLLEDTIPFDDLLLIADHNGLPRPTAEAKEIMIEVAKHGLGLFSARIKDALELAEVKRERIGWEHFIKAHNIAQKLSNPQATKAHH
jgi:DNA transposition AAA+ family ATPase